MTIGGSLLPSTPRAEERVYVGKHGVLRVVPSTELDTHFLTLGQRILAEHPNGCSCAELAKRILTAWDNPCVVSTRRVLEQVKYIVDCGGMTRSERTFVHILKGE
jgi:hypothetical protein